MKASTQYVSDGTEYCSNMSSDVTLVDEGDIYGRKSRSYGVPTGYGLSNATAKPDALSPTRGAQQFAHRCLV